jgi:hypothetical protein
MSPTKKGMLVGAGFFAVLFTITALNVSKSDIFQLLIVQLLISSAIGFVTSVLSRERKTSFADNTSDDGNVGDIGNVCKDINSSKAKDDATPSHIKDGSSASQPVDNEMTPLYKAAIGDKNQNYYLSRFQKFDEQDSGAQVSWNWAAFLIPSYWWLYRKMYGWWILLAAGFALSITKPECRILYSLLATVSAVFSNSLYHRHIKATIAGAKSKQLEGEQLLEYLSQKNGVNQWVYEIAIATPILIVIIVIIGWLSPR